MLYNGVGCIQPRIINWHLLCIPKLSRWHTWEVSPYLLLQLRAYVALFDNPALFLLFEIFKFSFLIEICGPRDLLTGAGRALNAIGRRFVF
jgi:hypothetical protein